MEFSRLQIPDVVLIRPSVFEDERGFFLEAWHRRTFAAAGLEADFVQDNHSSSRHGVLRGLHYQLGRPQGKLIRVTHGTIFDVAVDLRRSSPTFGRWVGVELSQDNRCQLWAPPGFAHGFFVLSERAECLYKCTDYYDPQTERTLRWDDERLGITWPLPPGVRPILSAKDAHGSGLLDCEYFD